MFVVNRCCVLIRRNINCAVRSNLKQKHCGFAQNSYKFWMDRFVLAGSSAKMRYTRKSSYHQWSARQQNLCLHQKNSSSTSRWRSPSRWSHRRYLLSYNRNWCHHRCLQSLWLIQRNSWIFTDRWRWRPNYFLRSRILHRRYQGRKLLLLRYLLQEQKKWTRVSWCSPTTSLV